MLLGVDSIQLQKQIYAASNDAHRGYETLFATSVQQTTKFNTF